MGTVVKTAQPSLPYYNLPSPMGGSMSLLWPLCCKSRYASISPMTLPLRGHPSERRARVPANHPHPSPQYHRPHIGRRLRGRKLPWWQLSRHHHHPPRALTEQLSLFGSSTFPLGGTQSFPYCIGLLITRTCRCLATHGEEYLMPHFILSSDSVMYLS